MHLTSLKCYNRYAIRWSAIHRLKNTDQNNSVCSTMWFSSRDYTSANGNEEEFQRGTSDGMADWENNHYKSWSRQSVYGKRDCQSMLREETVHWTNDGMADWENDHYKSWSRKSVYGERNCQSMLRMETWHWTSDEMADWENNHYKSWSRQSVYGERNCQSMLRMETWRWTSDDWENIKIIITKVGRDTSFMVRETVSQCWEWRLVIERVMEWLIG